MRFDAVVAGGGHNGLVAATLLARAGRSVCVLERRDEVGGAAVSVRPWPGVDARLSRYAYLVSLFPSSLRARLGVATELRPRGGREPDAFASPAVQAWRELTGRAARALSPTLLEPLQPRNEVLAGLDGDVREALFEAPLAVALERFFDDDEVRGTILTDGLIGTFASAAESSLRQNRCFLYHVIGDGHGRWDVPVGGMGRLTDELAAAARRAGAVIRVGVEVESIDSDGTDAEVACAGGARITARHVLVGAGSLARPLLGSEEAEAEPPWGSQLKLNMLVRRLPRPRESDWTPEQAFTGTFHVNEGYAQLERAYREASAGVIPSLPPCELYCHSLTDPSILGPELRAAGAHTLTVFGLHMPAWLFAGGAAAHAAAKADAIAATIRSLESVFAEPLEDCLWRDADGVPCLEALNPDRARGRARDARRAHLPPRSQLAVRRVRRGRSALWGVETSLANVWICGAAARRGGGVSGIPGHNAARAVLAAGDRVESGLSAPRRRGRDAQGRLRRGAQRPKRRTRSSIRKGVRSRGRDIALNCAPLLPEAIVRDVLVVGSRRGEVAARGQHPSSPQLTSRPIKRSRTRQRVTRRDSTTCERVRWTRPSRCRSMISRSRSALSCVRTRAIASASPVTLHASTTSGVAAQRRRDLVEQRPGGEEQLDERLGRVAERSVIDDGGETLAATPSRRSRSTRRLTAGADSATRRAMSS